MKTILYFSILAILLTTTCCVTTHNVVASKRMEIIQTDLTSDYFVFKMKTDSADTVIVLAEKKHINKCLPFKKYILVDSIHQTSIIKSGSENVLVGFYLATIDGIKIRNNGELIKTINNCDCFTDK